LRTEYEVDAWSGGAATGSGEFTPKAAVVAVSEPGRPRGNQVFDRLYPPASWLAGSLITYAGRAQVLQLRGAGIHQWAVVETGPEGATIAWHQLDFPGWMSYLDGRLAAHYVPPYHPDEDSTFGFILVDVPPGRHTVELVFGTTPARMVGNGLTALSLMAAALLAVFWARRTPPVGTAARASLPWQSPAAAGLLVASGLAWAQLGTETLRGVWPARACAAADGLGCAASEPPARVWGLLGGPVAQERIVLDLVEAVNKGRAQLASPTGTDLGSDAFLDVGWLRLGEAEPGAGANVHAGRERRWLYMHPPSSASVQLQVPGDAYFQAGMALRPASWSTDYGDGVRFVVEVAGADGRTAQLLSQRLNPRAHADERKWVEARVDLGAYTGQSVRLTLRTEPADDVQYDWAGWGNPVVVVDSSIRRPANGPRPPQAIAAP
jgi:hypothetical protein